MSLSGAEEGKLLAQGGAGALPVGTSSLVTQPFAQTFDRRMAAGTVLAPTSATMYVTGIWLPAGAVVTGITFVSGSTAESGGTHLWYALYKSDLTFMAQSTDDTAAAAMAANTALRKALTAAQTCPYTGLYYLAFCVVGTPPTLLNATAATANANGGITGMTPIMAATSTTGLTATAPSPAGALTAIAQSLYAFVD